MSGADTGDPAVVVPAVGSPSATCIVRSLGRRGVHTIAASERPSPPASWSRYCEETVAVPSPSEDLGGYRDALLSLARRVDVAAITPVREADVYVLAKHRTAFAEHVAPLWPTFDRLEAVHDRELLLDAAERAGVPVPRTRRLDGVDDWDAERIVKARYAVLTDDYVEDGPSDRCVHPPKTMYLEPGERPDVGAIVDAMGHVPIAQAYLDGTEYCLRAICRDGEALATSQKRLRRGYKYPRGPSVHHDAVDVPRLRELGVALLSELEWDGVASVGFIRDDEGTFRLLEVNPRFWSNLPMDVYAGVDYPGYYWRLAGGERDLPDPAYRPGVASHLLRGEVAHLHSVLFEAYPMVERPSLAGTLREVATSLVRHPRFDLLSLRDPGPFARDLLDAAGSTLPSVPWSIDVDATVGDAGVDRVADDRMADDRVADDDEGSRSTSREPGRDERNRAERGGTDAGRDHVPSEVERTDAAPASADAAVEERSSGARRGSPAGRPPTETDSEP